jgi:glycosyltransferase involved in cell wall biosynthesis
MSRTAPLHVLHLITDLDVGGAELMLARLAGAADRRRFRMSVVSLIKPGSVADELAAKGVSVQHLGLRRGAPDPRAILSLARLLRRERPDVLQTWLYHADLLGLIAGRMAGVPRILWNLRCSDMDLRRYSWTSAATVRLLARLSRLPDAVLVNSRAGRRAHERMGYRPRRWELVANGIDVERFRPDSDARAKLRAELRFAADDFVICLPARLDPMKDHATFFAAAQRFAREEPRARFVLVGRGVSEAGRRQRADLGELSGAAVRLLGERHDMPAVFAAADIVTLSSAFGEGFPNVVAEAMACGIPVVSTDVGDAAEIIGETGLVVPPRDPAAMAAAWKRLLFVGPDARAQMSKAARERIVGHYGLAAMVARYEAIYDSVVRATGSGGA